MKVAIIGAGPSGLSCAYELKKHGIFPDVFERNSQIGNPLEHTAATLRLFNSFNVSPMKYFTKKYGLQVSEASILREIIMKTHNKEKTVRGALGYIFKLGTEKYSIENQIAFNSNIAVTLNTFMDIDKIRNEYDYIVVATGEGSIPKKLGLWQTQFNTAVRIATVIGSFKTDCLKMWINKDYSRSCYAYLIASSQKQANLTLLLNDASHNDLDFYWKEFLNNEKLSYMITETKDLEYNLGTVNNVQTKNIYLTGSAAGLTDDFLGFGIIRAIESGILAARSILFGTDYQSLLTPLLEEVKAMHEFRIAFNTFDDKDIGKLVAFLTMPPAKQLIYNNPLAKARCATPFVRLFNSYKYGNSDE